MEGIVFFYSNTWETPLDLYKPHNKMIFLVHERRDIIRVTFIAF